MDLDKECRKYLDAASSFNEAPPQARHRVRKRLGAALAAGTLSTSITIAQAAGATVSLTGSLTSAALGSVLVGFTVGVVVIAPTFIQHRSEHSRSTAVVASSPLKPLPSRVSAFASAAVETPEVPSAEPAPTRENAAPASKPAKDSIAREAELLAEAQRALKSGAPEVALKTLNRYLDDCPKARLNEEATATRVVALCSLGRTDEGKRWAVEFEKKYANSPLLLRVRNACSSRKPSQIPTSSGNEPPVSDSVMKNESADTKHLEETKP
jgi:hypothetical protein